MAAPFVYNKFILTLFSYLNKYFDECVNSINDKIMNFLTKKIEFSCNKCTINIEKKA